MKVIIEEKDFKKEIEIDIKETLKNVSKLGVFSFVGREVNRVRPPRRNIGFVFNWITAGVITDAIMNAVCRTNKKKEDAVVDCESYEEVIANDESRKNDP